MNVRAPAQPPGDLDWIARSAGGASRGQVHLRAPQTKSGSRLIPRDRKPFGIPEVVALGMEIEGQPHRHDGLDSVIAVRHGLSATVAWSSAAQAIPNVHRIDARREPINQSSAD